MSFKLITIFRMFLSVFASSNQIFDCSGGISGGRLKDPKILYTGAYKDGQGVFVKRENVTHPYIFPLVRQCWWEYYSIQGEVFFTPWKQAGGQL